ncbi:MAG: flagellar hook-basal body complex protein FliE [Holophagaceae bacterium]|jgi:flagellar hook-basal body complex protein FliE|nr:flagellar hook-basal body complex protein FliE [Holophagaceae bacterium]
MDPLLNLNTLNPIKPLGQSEAPGTINNGQNSSSFSDLLKRALNEVNMDEKIAELEARNLMTGQGTDMHTVVLAVQKADVSFNTMMAVRSKLVDAYREVMRMQM